MNACMTKIGFSSQQLRFEFVRHAALLGLEGIKGKTIASELDQYLSEKLSTAGARGRGSREKLITVLKRIWAPDTKQLMTLRNEGFSLLRQLPEIQHLAVHWGMTMASYPFWSTTATCVGRLLRLQGTTNSAQIRRRIQENYGDREIVGRATRSVVRSFVSWGVLQETGAKGIYSAGATLAVDDLRLIAWLAEASLYARASGSAPLKDLLDGPSFFPFSLKPIQAENIKAVSTRLDVFRQGLYDDLVILRRPPGTRHL